MATADSAGPTPHCPGCGRTPDACAGCLPAFDPPRFCSTCGRRLVVQVTPTHWTARCRPCATELHSPT